MKNYINKFCAIFLIFCLTSCATKQQTGTGVGAMTGALLGAIIGESTGNAAAGAAFGAVIGGVAGSAIGHKLDENDKKLMGNATMNALENTKSGKKIKWRNPDNGHEGFVTPVKTYEVEGRYCREFVQEANIGGEKAKVYGKACRQPDGQWEIISASND